jgi:uncharacterized protein (DUF849 family)
MRAMTSPRKIIITCAITGSAHTPTMSPYLPITPEQIADEAIAAAAAGAAIVHLHARDPQTGRPTSAPDVYAPAVEKIRRACDAVINITTSGGATATVEQRMEAALRLKPEIASLNMGSISPYGRHRLVERFADWQHGWERDLLLGGRSRTYINTEEVIERILTEVGRNGTRCECECYDIGHLYNVAYFLERGLLKPPVMIQTVFGFSGGIGLHPENITHARSIADRLFGTDYSWSILAPGRHQFRLCTMAAVMGANVRVGLEDNLYLAKGELARSNADQVRRMRQILELLSFEIATPAEARRMLKLDQAGMAAASC